MDYADKKNIDDEKKAQEYNISSEKLEKQTIYKTRFAERFKYAYKHKKMNKYQIAKQTGISSGLLSSYEKGEKSPVIENAKIISDCLGVSLDWLCGEGELTPGIIPWSNVSIAMAFLAIIDRYDPKVEFNDKSPDVTLSFKFDDYSMENKYSLRDFLKSYISLNTMVNNVEGSFDEFQEFYFKLIKNYEDII